jgi:hypothetical protein
MHKILYKKKGVPKNNYLPTTKISCQKDVVDLNFLFYILIPFKKKIFYEEKIYTF